MANPAVNQARAQVIIRVLEIIHIILIITMEVVILEMIMATLVEEATLLKETILMTTIQVEDHILLMGTALLVMIMIH